PETIGREDYSHLRLITPPLPAYGRPIRIVSIVLITVVPRRDFVNRAVRVLVANQVDFTLIGFETRLASVQFDDAIQQASERHDLGDGRRLIEVVADAFRKHLHIFE